MVAREKLAVVCAARLHAQCKNGQILFRLLAHSICCDIRPHLEHLKGFETLRRKFLPCDDQSVNGTARQPRFDATMPFNESLACGSDAASIDAHFSFSAAFGNTALASFSVSFGARNGDLLASLANAFGPSWTRL